MKACGEVNEPQHEENEHVEADGEVNETNSNNVEVDAEVKKPEQVKGKTRKREKE